MSGAAINRQRNSPFTGTVPRDRHTKPDGNSRLRSGGSSTLHAANRFTLRKQSHRIDEKL